MTAQPAWRPWPIWDGETVYVLGTGPSLRAFDVERLRGREAIAINQSAYLARWARVLFFTDEGWIGHDPGNQALIETWRGLVVTVSTAAAEAFPGRVLRVVREEAAGFPAIGSGTIKAARASGHLAVALAVAMGAARVVLLGYDMRQVDGRAHWHDAYDLEHDAVLDTQRAAWAGWGAAAAAAGVEIVNATPGSALTEFPIVDLEAVL